MKKAINFFKMKNKKSQTNGNGATIVVLLVLGLIVAFSLFISPSERQRLLNETPVNNTNNGNEQPLPSRTFKILLNKVPGHLYARAFNSMPISLSSIYLSAIETGKQLFNINQLQISSTVFHRNPQTLTFNIDNPKTITKIYLSFNVIENKGILTILFNNNPIYVGKLEKGTLKTPFQITNLFNKTNTITFKVSSPGWMFWRKNEYTLRNIVVAANVINFEKENATIHTFLDYHKLNNLKQVYFTYYADCDQSSIGKLIISVNHKIISSAVPACLSLNQIPLDKRILKDGVNDFKFSISQGNVKLEKMSLSLKYGKGKQPIYYFYLTKKELDALKDNKAKVKMILNFVNSGNSLELNIDGNNLNIDTDQKSYLLDITNYINNMNSYIQIIPKSDTTISSLEVYIK